MDTGTGTIELDVTVTFTSSAHGFTITVEDPQVVLDGEQGQLFASDQTSGDPGTYDRSKPVFDLDLSAATVTLHPDGTRTLGGIFPAGALEPRVKAARLKGTYVLRVPGRRAVSVKLR